MLVPQGTSAIMELSRANSIAEKLGSKSMLLPGVAPSALPPPDADIVEGLRAGDDTAFFEAADAYLEVCNDAHCDKSYMQTWQRHAAAPFAEALMDLVAIYRTTQPAAAPPALALPPAGGAAARRRRARRHRWRRRRRRPRRTAASRARPRR